MKNNSQTPGSSRLPLNAAAHAAGRGSDLPNPLNGNRPTLGGFIALALLVLRAGPLSKVDKGMTEGQPKDDRETVGGFRRRSGLAARVSPSTALCASHHG